MKIAVSTEMDYLGNPQMTRILCNQDYVQYVLAAGYQPYIVGVGMNIDAIADDMDGLLLTGGKDLSPLIYGEDLEWSGANKCNLVRDIYERDLYRAFVTRGKPVFGICRGFQLICILSNDELKSRFYQNINRLKEVSLMHQQGDVDITGENPVHVIDTRGVLKDLVGRFLPTNSFHHQGFVMKGKTNPGWIRQCEDVFCWARSKDEAYILEAFGMNVEDGVRVAGVQYHPERMMRREKDREKHLALFRYTMGSITSDWQWEDPDIVDARDLAYGTQS